MTSPSFRPAAPRLLALPFMRALALLVCFSCEAPSPAVDIVGTGGAHAQPGTGGAFGPGGSGGGGGGAKIDAPEEPIDSGVPAQADGGSAADGPAATDAGAADLPSDVTPLDGPIPACTTASTFDVRACVFGADGKLVTTGSDAMVTVTKVDETMTVCDPQREGSAATNAVLFKRLAVESATGTKWTVLIRIPNLPAAQVSAGQTLQMTVMASPLPALGYTAANHTVVFSRQGSLVLFASDVERRAASVAGPWTIPTTKYDALPDLGPWGLTLSDSGAACSSNLINCLRVAHRANVTWGGALQTVGAGETVRSGSLSFSLARFEQMVSNGACDAGGQIRLGGFVTGS